MTKEERREHNLKLLRLNIEYLAREWSKATKRDDDWLFDGNENVHYREFVKEMIRDQEDQEGCK